MCYDHIRRFTHFQELVELFWSVLNGSPSFFFIYCIFSLLFFSSYFLFLLKKAFHLAQNVCGPLHRSSAAALECMSFALVHLSSSPYCPAAAAMMLGGDGGGGNNHSEVAVAHQTRALAIHQQLGGFDTPDAAVAHYVLGTALHKVNKQKTKQNKEREREKRKKRKKDYDMNQGIELKD